MIPRNWIRHRLWRLQKSANILDSPGRSPRVWSDIERQAKQPGCRCCAFRSLVRKAACGHGCDDNSSKAKLGRRVGHAQINKVTTRKMGLSSRSPLQCPVDICLLVQLLDANRIQISPVSWVIMPGEYFILLRHLLLNIPQPQITPQPHPALRALRTSFILANQASQLLDQKFGIPLHNRRLSGNRNPLPLVHHSPRTLRLGPLHTDRNRSIARGDFVR
jgi:hypothetical protein